MKLTSKSARSQYVDFTIEGEVTTIAFDENGVGELESEEKGLAILEKYEGSFVIEQTVVEAPVINETIALDSLTYAELLEVGVSAGIPAKELEQYKKKTELVTFLTKKLQ